MCNHCPVEMKVLSQETSGSFILQSTVSLRAKYLLSFLIHAHGELIEVNTFRAFCRVAKNVVSLLVLPLFILRPRL